MEELTQEQIDKIVAKITTDLSKEFKEVVKEAVTSHFDKHIKDKYVPIGEFQKVKEDLRETTKLLNELKSKISGSPQPVSGGAKGNWKTLVEED